MIEKILLGSTEIKVSRLGLGTAKWGRNQNMHYPSPFDLPSETTLMELLQTAKELGINLLDTAPAYGISEQRIGQLFTKQKYSRHEWVISTKVGELFEKGHSFYDFSKKFIIQSIQNSLKQLKTDYLDIVFIHSNGEDKKIIEETEGFETLFHLKKSGLIRAIGMSTKTVEGGLLALPFSDVLMVTYNPLNTDEKPVILKAHEQQKGIFIKKALASGHLEKIGAHPIQSAMKIAFSVPISSVILGTLNPQHLVDNAKMALSVLSL